MFCLTQKCCPVILPLFQVQEVEAVLKGNLPEWLAGSFLLNGGGDYTGMDHMFDGYALISKMRVSGGRVYGSQRYLQSEAYKWVPDTIRSCFWLIQHVQSNPQQALVFPWCMSCTSQPVVCQKHVVSAKECCIY